jgi:hypothetical protein
MPGVKAFSAVRGVATKGFSLVSARDKLHADNRTIGAKRVGVNVRG